MFTKRSFEVGIPVLCVKRLKIWLIKIINVWALCARSYTHNNLDYKTLALMTLETIKRYPAGIISNSDFLVFGLFKLSRFEEFDYQVSKWFSSNDPVLKYEKILSILLVPQRIQYSNRLLLADQ